MGNGSRIHIEKTLPDGIRINCFGDDPDEVVQTMSTVIALAQGFYPDMQLKTSHEGRPSHQPQPAARSPKPATNRPVCPACGSDASVELVTFKLRETGQQVSRFKCQDCNKWVGKTV